MATLVLGLTLLAGVTAASALPAPDHCCICTRCAGGASCAPISDPTECSTFCDTVNATACGSDVVNVSCSSPELASECNLAGAPVLGTSGLTIVTVLLSAFGIVGLRRAARRQRA